MDFKKQITEYLSLEKKVIESLNVDEINETMNALLDCYNRGGTVYTCGNGGSASTASHMVCDFGKGTCYELEKKFHFVCLNDNIPTIMAIANDDSYENIFAYQLKDKLTKNDILLAVSGSGNSHNIVKAADYAKEVGAKIIGMTGYNGGKLMKMADYHLHAPIDDMQITEDVHIIFNHLMMKIFWVYLQEKNGKKAIYKINQ
jgi:D-sedoheptulose 7-phosphate isomerase